MAFQRRVDKEMVSTIPHQENSKGINYNFMKLIFRVRIMFYNKIPDAISKFLLLWLHAHPINGNMQVWNQQKLCPHECSYYQMGLMWGLVVNVSIWSPTHDFFDKKLANAPSWPRINIFCYVLHDFSNITIYIYGTQRLIKKTVGKQVNLSWKQNQ